ncbi:hypothetical protein [Paraburkholderia hospita]|uniref:hypothetical protein n=1 Tax=Paraburkholderia hospita TaxID=169430 RepID=UPI0012603048|nr:hypothetical protein [Paraburkholderia hospita]
MVRHLRHRRLLIVASIISTMFGIRSIGAFADNQNPDVVPPQQSVDGMTYGQWSAQWWEWLLAIPYGKNLPNPSFYSTGHHCSVNQSGRVWFLTEPTSGTMGSGAVEQCKVPTGSYILIPLLTAECSSRETAPTFIPTPCSDDTSCRACAKTLADSILPGSLVASVDGTPVTGLQSSSTPFPVQSPLFYFTMPERNWFSAEGDMTPAGEGFAVSDGYWLMIKPLSVGTHTIHVEGAVTGFEEKVTYKITVGEP